MTPTHWKIIFDGYGDKGRSTGDVYTKDGEIIGTWKADENDHCSFTALGETEVTLSNVFLGLLVRDIAAWHEAKEGGA